MEVDIDMNVILIEIADGRGTVRRTYTVGPRASLWFEVGAGQFLGAASQDLYSAIGGTTASAFECCGWGWPRGCSSISWPSFG